MKNKRSIPFKKLITEYNMTGICPVNVDLVVKAWTDKYFISQHHNEFRLIRQYHKESCGKVTISKEQAEEIINKLGLYPIQSSLFRFGITYRSEENILSEIDRLNKILEEKRFELNSLYGIMGEFENALNKETKIHVFNE